MAISVDKRNIGSYSPEERNRKQTGVAKRVTSSKAEAVKFLKSAGILDKNGAVAKVYKNK